ncbi:MAG: glycine cleavage system protein GcvH [Candidatus Gracilibacteria bacterium]|jgi:glycine cleavage system H protein
MADHKFEEGLYYTKTHEWVKIDGDTATVGISDYAQDLLTDVVFVELPALQKQVKQFGTACVVESVKSVSDVYSPLSGTISEVNSELEKAPETVNHDPYGKGWIFKLTGFDSAEISNLLNVEAYKESVAKESH